MPKQELISVSQYARMKHVSTATVYSWITKGLITSTELSGIVFIDIAIAKNLKKEKAL